mgnify:CR=1 FL=1
MSDSSLIMTLLGQAMFLLPTILICIVGIAMIQKHLPAGKARKAGVLGLGLLLVGAISNLLFYALINRFMSSQDYSGHGHMQLVSTVYRIFSVLLHSGGLVLLIVAICDKAGQSGRKAADENPYGQ